MTVLSSPQGTPERVWSLISGLQSLGGSADRATFDALINPGYRQDDKDLVAQKPLADNATGAASSLSLIEVSRDLVDLKLNEPISSYQDFADYIHDWLTSIPAGDDDGILLESYAWIVAESDKQVGLNWYYDLSNAALADRANTVIASDDADGGLMNSTRVPAWRRWLAFLGLGIPNPTPRAPEFPFPTVRLLRELERSELPQGTEVSAEEFLSLVARRMPYLDRGRLFVQACKRLGHPPPLRELTPLFSAALRDLHDEGVLQLVPRGDASDNVRLSQDAAHRIQTFVAIKLAPRDNS